MARETSLLSVLRGLLCVSSLPVSANGITEAPSPAPRKAGLEPGRSSAQKMWARGKKREKKRPPVVAPLPQPQPPRFLEPGHSRLDLRRCPSGLPERRLGEVLTWFCQQPPRGPCPPRPLTLSLGTRGAEAALGVLCPEPAAWPPSARPSLHAGLCLLGTAWKKSCRLPCACSLPGRPASVQLYILTPKL